MGHVCLQNELALLNEKYSTSSVKKILTYYLEPSLSCQLILAHEVSKRARICSHAENRSKTSQSGFVSRDLCYKSDYLYNEAGKKGKVELIFFTDLNPSL